MVIALYGGSFNPVHRGHFDSALASLEMLGADKFIFIPASVPPHKKLAKHSPSSKERADMLSLCVGDIPKTEVSHFEVEKADKPSYTARTIDHFRKKYPDAKFILLIGTDMFLSFESWYEFKHILKHVTLGVFPRETGETEEIEKFAKHMRKKYDAKVKVIAKTPLPMTSSDVRELLPLRKGRELVPEPVYAHIIKNRYYGAKGELAWLREQAKLMLKPNRVAHVLGCESEAVSLAKRWSVDETEAAEAAILHDITKKLKLPEQLKLCKEYDIMLDTTEEKNSALLHAKTGAMLAYDIFAISAEVRDAIFWHTTAKADMTELEKIIYMADYIEPNRDFDGVEKIRKLAYENLDEAMILGLQMSQEDLRSKNIEQHPKSSEALQWFLNRREK